MSKELEAKAVENITFLANLGCRDVMDYSNKKMSMEIIEQALKRNEPMKVKEVLICDDPRIIVHHCPNCDEELFKTDISYCPYCGQKLDWSK
mgnify:CR=1 FL=1